jgi:uncharacterized protein YfdQ (DUF2303 family)
MDKPQPGQLPSREQIIADLARRAEKSTFDPRKGSYLDAASFVVLRDAEGKERIEWLHDIARDPARKTGTVKLNDAPSFNAYYAIHGNGAPVYATLKPASFTAVLNDHTVDKAGWRDHRALFVVAHSDEWLGWLKSNRVPFTSNEDFAKFIEDNAPDIIEPDGAEMLDIALNFRVKADVSFSVAQRLSDGHLQFGYQNNVSASAGTAPAGGGEVTIPEIFKISIPVWQGVGSKDYEVEARFRYRLKEGKLSIWYELVRPHKIVEQAFADLWEEIKDATKAPILHGTPE